MQVEQRLLKYVSYWTTSDENNMADGKIQIPSTERQFDLGKVLEQELRDLGLKNVILTDHCYVYGLLPATAGCEGHKAVGFISHMDTAPDYSGKDIKPQIIPDYDGGDVRLNGTGAMLKVSDFPTLKDLKGRTLITTDGTTLLGADDKAGVAEIMTLAETLLAGEFPHGQISIAFTPDEEIGEGADFFDVPGFDAEFAYTVDGGAEGEIEFENFNAAGAKFTVTGFNVHPGSAKDTMINAIAVASEIQSLLPEAESPRNTEGYEGFYHLTDMSGNVEKAEMQYIVRDHDLAAFELRKKELQHIQAVLNGRYGEGTVELTITEQYRNMSEKILPHFHLIENAKAAAEEIGLKPLIVPVRGGTDGAQLSFRGLPCPDIGTGGYAYHGPYEHITAEGMDLSVDLILGVLKRYASFKAGE